MKTESMWETKHSAQASAQGWDIFECDGAVQLQADDEAGVFCSDEDALAFVVSQAAKGDELARLALEQIR